MENKKTEKGKSKSTILLLVSIFFLFNAALMFRASINTLYFTEDTSGDYAPVQATVKELKPDPSIQAQEEPRVIPVFTFSYKGKEMTMEAPRLAFTQTEQPGQIFKQGEEHTLWVHRRRGELTLPPIMGQKETGRSQLLISAVFLLFAVGIWIVRNRIGANPTR